ncbi:MAG: hypothetical protein QG608_3424 [Actinomycetota bacterium]|nr:hypothetical protein [Actinomycetota bacterium]
MHEVVNEKVISKVQAEEGNEGVCRGYGRAMALLHEATLTPGKNELIEPWLRTRPWWDGQVRRGPVASFRLDDPAGQVGLECFLFGSPSGETLFVPVTYRGAPLAGAGSSLVGMMEHSALGTRYVYDACGDPVFVATVLDTIRCGGRQADLRLLKAVGTEVVRVPTATAHGDGAPDVPAHDPEAPVSAVDGTDRTTITGDAWELTVQRRLGPAPDGPGLTGSYEGGADLRLAVLSG